MGDLVLALNLREGPKWYQATVVQKLGINVYSVNIHCLDVTWKRYYHQLLPRSVKVNDEFPRNKTSLSKDQSPNRISSENIIPKQTSTPPQQFQQSDVPMCDFQPVVNCETCDNGNKDVTSDTIELRRSIRVRKPVVRYGFD